MTFVMGGVPHAGPQHLLNEMSLIFFTDQRLLYKDAILNALLEIGVLFIDDGIFRCARPSGVPRGP